MNKLHFLVLITLVILTACTSKAPNSIEPTFFNSEQVLLTGRFELTAPQNLSFTWSGSELAFNFHGTTAKINIESESRIRFQLSVDGVTSYLYITPEKTTYDLAKHLAKGAHKVRLIRLSESSAGVTTFTSMPIIDGHFLSAPTVKKQKILVLGDSITAGYGVEGESEKCGYSIETSNPLLSYASIAATNLDAELHIIAWSGIGVWRSYGEKIPKQATIITRHTRALADNEDSVWSSQNFQPDVIWLTIGTNDFWDGSAEGYKDAMTVLLGKLQQDYLNKPIYLIMSPMIKGKKRQLQRGILQELTSQNIKVLDLGKIEHDDGYGCHYHPNIKTQRRMGKELQKQMELEMGW